MINSIIVDDEIPERERLKALLKQYYPRIRVVNEGDSLLAAVKFIRQYKPELIFLDIKIRSETAFDLLDIFRDEALNVILVTEHREYALSAIQYGVLGYIIKPVDPADFKVAVQRAMSRIDERRMISEVRYQKKIPNKESGIIVNFKGGFKHIEYRNILYLEAYGNYTKLHLADSGLILSSQTLGEYEKRLDKDLFLRVHRSYIVNLEYTKNAMFRNDMLIIENRISIPIPKKRQHELKTRIINYIK